VIGSCDIGPLIDRGERNLVERVAVRFNRREEITLPLLAGYEALNEAESVRHGHDVKRDGLLKLPDRLQMDQRPDPYPR
jgi:hypothetical protein